MAASKRPPVDPKTGTYRVAPSQRPTRAVDIRDLGAPKAAQEDALLPQARIEQGRLIISHPHAIPPEAETNVPCPVCRKGMVSATVAASINKLLKEQGDGPSGASMPPPSPPDDDPPPEAG